ncbi:MAG: LysR family transcriptional regulator [Candidatus Promineifilaceae bacterium]|nr:LysR family transcriptional regulator [Candidatus Promineifilaceae bacterium]
MLDAHQLNVFLTASETLNFTAAARQLHMTQPSVSQHIQALEQHFQTSLFVRQGRQMVLTDAGEALVPLARRLVDWSVRIDETMESLQGQVYGHLKVGCSTTSGKYVLPFLLTSFMKRHPQVRATCQVAPRRQAVDDLCDGLIHLALASPRDFCSQVEFRKFIADPILLIVPCSHPWAHRRHIEAEELLNADFILREQGSGTFEVAAAGLESVGLSIDQLSPVLTLGNSEAIALAVEEGLGVGFVSRIVVTRLVADRVAPVRVRGLEMHQDVYIGRNTSLPGTTAQNAFWDFVTDPTNPILAELTKNGFETVIALD